MRLAGPWTPCLSAMDLMNDVPPAYLAAAATAACGLYACCKAPPGPSASELTPPDAELKPEAIAALSTVPENLAGVYDYDGKTGAFKLEHSEAGVPYNKTEKETMVAKASLSLKAARYACSLSRSVCVERPCGSRPPVGIVPQHQAELHVRVRRHAQGRRRHQLRRRAHGETHRRRRVHVERPRRAEL